MNPDSPHRCGSCGEALAPGGSFCRACGARYEQPACDACQAPVMPGTAFCRACGAPVSGAAAGSRDPEPTLVRPAQPSPGPAPPGPSRQSRGRTPLLIAAAILLLGTGAAAAIVLAGGGSDSSTTTVDAGPSTGGTGERGEEEEAEPVEDVLPPQSRPEMEEEIEALLLAYHEDVVESDFRSAWALLSSRKRQQNLAEYGYREWMRAQASLSEDLSPSGLQAQIDALEDRGDGVARVLVTGMGWSAPTSSCVEWSGLTWVRYEHGEWTYDPGYSTTPTRRRAWEHRVGDLLGAGC